MDINQYRIYSALSRSENKKIDELQYFNNIIKSIEKADSYSTLKSVHTEKYNIEISSQRQNISSTCFIETVNTDYQHIVKFLSPNNDYVYHFKKEEE